jgi:hypothetical protein
MLLTQTAFKRYQDVFHKKIMNTPFKVTIEITTVTAPTTEGFSMEKFVGGSPRTPKFYEVNALYEREIPLRTREKYGLPKEVNGVVYFSPIQLKQVIGTFELDWNKTKIHFAGSVQVIQKIELLEPLYNECLGVQVFLKDALKGG